MGGAWAGRSTNGWSGAGRSGLGAGSRLGLGARPSMALYVAAASPQVLGKIQSIW